ncbi:hypothetical protein [Streptomyces sp. NPDC058657]|uniref:hypothetical protein n=1 Tax=unclassified Streptomyces TaxID=2593676 RepID=UPI00365B436F
MFTTFADWAAEAAVAPYEEPVYIRLQPKAAEDLALAAGFPIYPPPLPDTAVKVRTEVPCPACGQGSIARTWRVERRVLLAGAGCRRRHVFVMAPPLPILRKENEA